MEKTQVLETLKIIGKSYGWDAIYEIAKFRGQPVYELRNSSIPKGAKTGYPHLYSLNEKIELYELDTTEIHEVIVSRNLFRKRLQ